MSASERVASMSPEELIAVIERGLEADERAARALDGATRMLGGKPDFTGQGGPAAEAFWSHVTPPRILAEVESKREILERYRTLVQDFTHVNETVFEHTRRMALEEVLEALARPYLAQETP